jgi:cytochrome P450
MTVEDTYFPRRFGPLELVRRARTNQLSLFGPELFGRNLLYSRLLFLDSFLVNHPDYIERVLLTNQQNYAKSHFVRRLLGPVLGQGLFTAEGEFWRRQRRIAAPAFQHRRIEGFVDIMADAAEARIGRWRGREGGFDLSAEMMGLTLEIIARTLFSTDVRG